jgi:hypothetical protein
MTNIYKKTASSGTVVNSVTGNGSILATPTTGNVVVELQGLTNHSILVGAGTTTITNVGPTATAGQVFQSQGGSTDPAFSTATYPATTTINDILYSSSANVVGQITTADNGVLITGTTGIPSFLANGTTGQVLTATTGSPPSWEAAGGASAPAFYAYASANQTNVTGDGTFVDPVLFNSTTVNRSSSYSTGTSTFTAPATGVYLFYVNLYLYNLGAAHTAAGALVFVNGATVYNIITNNPYLISDAGTLVMNGCSGSIALNSGDTVVVTLQVTGGTKTVDLGGALGNSSFSGFQIL